jgi:hypothetical protein
MRKYYFLTFLLLAGGCVSVPKETAILSGEVGNMIASSKASHLALLNQYEAERRGRIDDFLQAVWIPRLIGQMAKDGDLWGKTCKIANTTDSALELQGFVEAAALRIAAKRKELTDALDYAMADLRAEVDAHYGLLERSNSTITRNLKSVNANDEVLGTLLKKNGVDVEKLTPLRDVSAKLDKLMKKGD